MKNLLNTPVIHGMTLRDGLATLLSGVLALTPAGCGGDGADGDVTGLSSGGIGSIIVNGVRYDDTGARVKKMTKSSNTITANPGTAGSSR